MDFLTLRKKIADNAPPGVSERFKRLTALEQMLDGTAYQVLEIPFDNEYDVGDRYIPMRDRRPSLVYNLPKIIVDQTSTLTFGEAHFPHIRCWKPGGVKSTPGENRNDEMERAIEHLIEFCSIEMAMLDAVYTGSVGCAAHIVRGLGDSKTPSIETIRGKFASPQFDPKDPSKLKQLTITYTVVGEELLSLGYEPSLVKKPDEMYWMKIEIDDKEERRFIPVDTKKYVLILQNLQKDPKDRDPEFEWHIDNDRSYTHGFNVVPVVWYVNPPANSLLDGTSTFECICDFAVEISYQLSQVGRGLRYSADPTMVVNSGDLWSLSPENRFNGAAKIEKDPSRAMVLGKDGDAKLLEMNGQGMQTSLEYVRLLREYAMEVVGGLKADSETAKGTESGRALEILNQALVWLVERLRVSYGTNGLIPLLRIIMAGIESGALVVDGLDKSSFDSTAPIRLVWPSWWTPRGADFSAHIQGLEMLAGGSSTTPVPLLSLATVTRLAAQAAGIDDPNRAAMEAVEEELQRRKEAESKDPASTQKDSSPDLKPPKTAEE